MPGETRRPLWGARSAPPGLHSRALAALSLLVLGSASCAARLCIDEPPMGEVFSTGVDANNMALPSGVLERNWRASPAFPGGPTANTTIVGWRNPANDTDLPLTWNLTAATTNYLGWQLHSRWISYGGLPVVQKPVPVGQYFFDSNFIDMSACENAPGEPINYAINGNFVSDGPASLWLHNGTWMTPIVGSGSSGWSDPTFFTIPGTYFSGARAGARYFIRAIVNNTDSDQPSPVGIRFQFDGWARVNPLAAPACMPLFPGRYIIVRRNTTSGLLLCNRASNDHLNSSQAPVGTCNVYVDGSCHVPEDPRRWSPWKHWWGYPCNGTGTDRDVPRGWCEAAWAFMGSPDAQPPFPPAVRAAVPETGGGGPPIAAIVGGVVGGLAVVGGVVAAVILLRRRGAKAKDADVSERGSENDGSWAKGQPKELDSGDRKLDPAAIGNGEYSVPSNGDDAAVPIRQTPVPVYSSGSFAASESTARNYAAPGDSATAVPSNGTKSSAEAPSSMATLAMATLQEPVSAGPLAPLESSRLLIAEADVSYDRAKVLGQGSFAVVYEGTLLGSTRVAVKVLRSALVDKATSRAFAREVGNWEGLAQRNILPLLAFCISPPMLISEIADGGNLRQYLGRRSWDQPLGLRLLVDVVRGMAYLHSKGILHGDLKSVNVLVDGSRALVCDFGLSRFRHPALGTATETAGPAMGTVGFMAPEMFTGAPLRAPADVYAFGMTCFEVVSGGGMPFGEGVNAMAAMYQVVFEKARPERPQGVQDGMWALMERCWRHEAGDRSTFVEVTSELEALVIPGSSE